MTETFDPYAARCPSRHVLDRVADKWSVLIIGALADGPLRHGQIAQRVDGISPKMLAQTLRSLERDGLVDREAHAEVPPRVVYTLTDAGRTLHPVLAGVEQWTRAHAGDVLAARDEYDRREAGSVS